jgi:hypothetical protein
LVSLYEFDGRGFDWLLRNDITFAGVDVRGAVGSDEFARLQTVLTARRPLRRDSNVDYLVYALNEYYVDQPNGPVDSTERSGSSVQYEVGFTLGRPRRDTSGAYLCAGRHRLPVRIAPGRVPNRDRDAFLTVS